MDSPARFTRPVIAFAIGVPLAWAVLLWFHPNVDPDHVYADLRDNVTVYQIVHVGTLIFIGLMGVSLYLLVRDMPGTAARISRLAIGPFVLLYGAWETVIGLAIGAMVQHGNDAPGQRPRWRTPSRASGTTQSSGSLVSWAFSERLHGSWPLSPPRWHTAEPGRRLWRGCCSACPYWWSRIPRPSDRVALVFFAAAVALLARWERASRAAGAEAPVPGPSDAVVPA